MTDPAEPPAGMLLVTIDRLPAWILSAYGSTWASCPAIDALAGRGIVFDRVIARSDDPLDALADLAGRGPAAATAWPLLAAAEAAGWQPTVVTDDASFVAALPAGVAVRQLQPQAAVAVADDPEETGLGRLLAAAAEAAAGKACRFLWCHAGGLGTAWDAPAEFREAYLDPDDPPPPPGAKLPDLVVDGQTDPDLIVALRHVFAAQVSLLDACLGPLLDAVATCSAGRPRTILLAGVRGIGLGLHGRIGCGPTPPFSELIQLPAILVDYHGRMAAQRYGGLLLPADLGVTLLELAGARPATEPDPRAGRSLVRLLDAWEPPDRDRIISRTTQGTAVATPAWQAVLPAATDSAAQAALLFAKPDDFFEVCDVADRCPEVADELATLGRRAGDDPAQAWSAPLSEPAVRGV
jgi:hypothetical protein